MSDVRKAVIVGNGIAAAMAAIALRRAFAQAGLEVTWIETPSAISQHDIVASLPNLQTFHQLLGISEADVLRAGHGAFTLGQQYVGFAGGEEAFLHSYGPTGHPVASLPFMQFWIKAKTSGLPAAYDDFGRDAVAAKNGRMQLPVEQGLPATAHGYHLDARGYAAVLKAHAAKLGVTISADDAPVAVVVDRRVSAIRLADGQTVAGDLFIDATGVGASILSAIDQAPSTDIAISTCNNLMIASGQPLRSLPLYSRIVAHRAGWSALYPLGDRTGVVVAYDGAQLSDDEAVALAAVPLIGEPDFVALAPQHRPRPWVGNVVAIGEAATVPEPLAATSLHRLQIAVTHLISLFPVRADVMVEADIYNEEIAAYHARLNDFQAAHYVLNRRNADAFWDVARKRLASAELDAKINLFAARGMIAQYNQESFSEEEWMAAFVGHGLMPRSYDPQVDKVPEQEVMANFRTQLASIRAEVTAMGTHEVALAKAMQG